MCCCDSALLQTVCVRAALKQKEDLLESVKKFAAEVSKVQPLMETASSNAVAAALGRLTSSADRQVAACTADRFIR